MSDEHANVKNATAHKYLLKLFGAPLSDQLIFLVLIGLNFFSLSIKDNYTAKIAGTMANKKIFCSDMPIPTNTAAINGPIIAPELSMAR